MAWRDCIGVRLERKEEYSSRDDGKAEWTDLCVLVNDDLDFKVVKRHGFYGGREEEKEEKQEFEDVADAVKRLVTIASFLVTARPRRIKLQDDDVADWHKVPPEYNVADTWGDKWPDALKSLKNGLNGLKGKWRG